MLSKIITNHRVISQNASLVLVEDFEIPNEVFSR